MSAAPGSAAKAVPQPTPVTEPFWSGTRAGELRLQRCADCAGHVFYPRIRCPLCGSAALEWVRASGRGRLYSYVINHLPAPGWKGEVPHVIAIVELDEGPRMMSGIVGVDPVPEQLPLDLRLEVAFEPRGDQMLPVFRPAEASR